MEGAQDTAEVLTRGERTLGVKAPGIVGVGNQRKAKELDQRGMLDEESAQAAHGGFLFLDFDQERRPCFCQSYTESTLVRASCVRKGVVA
jgi:hypothetical protein